jgi:hypothetical protein
MKRHNGKNFKKITFTKCTFYAQDAFMCFISFPEQAVIISALIINCWSFIAQI